MPRSPETRARSVRANNIFNKLAERHGLAEAAIVGALDGRSNDPISAATDEANDLWALVLEAARLDEVVDQSVRTLELSVLAKYAFSLAQSFNGFYHKYSILNEEREDTRVWRAAAVSYYKQQLTKALELMGCVVPFKM
jgi:arginyl-tRNA synthetase